MLKPLALLCLALLPLAAGAEVEKFAVVCETRMCFYWWPKVPPLPGWHQDRARSIEQDANVLVPDGRSFGDAPAVVYARAVYKPRVPESASLKAFIDQDRRTFLEKRPDIAIAEAGTVATGDGHAWRSLTFFPGRGGPWERVVYGEEGDFYLIFTLSANDKAAYDRAAPLFESWMKRYREAP